ncbi:unnamed protein product [Brachionus calyciflorus]|uniref:Methyltransferase FkbM domain-containing protein n=1 Tax=Brachionus calyciflorus TaxID=104777 RepID=A0A814H0J5_9BILA|nr:unnamed protein product [Brachionus calyciflorus]
MTNKPSTIFRSFSLYTILKKYFKLILILLIFVLGYLIIEPILINQIPIEENLSSKVNVIDFTKNLCPKNQFDAIKCRKSTFESVTSFLCVHDNSRDTGPSLSIWRDGVWEPNILKFFINQIKINPDCLILDVGAQVGQYAIFAAQMGRDVVSVEPFYDNVLRIQKSVRLNNLEKRIKLVKNAVSNKRGEIKRLEPVYSSIGAQSLLYHRKEIYTKEEMAEDKYLVETILFDDLIQVLPKNKDGKEYKTAILKIDIEGFEPFAFKSASELFERLDIRVIVMEWGYFAKQKDLVNDVEEMIQFLTQRNYEPHQHENQVNLTFDNWKTWPGDVYWIKK